MDKYIRSLNPAQHEAVTTTEGPLLVLAGAGSGKTRVITVRAAYLIHKGISPDSLIAVTFTNRAAREMRGRITSILKKSKKKTPIVSTFHSLCLQILRKEMKHVGLRKNFTIYDTSEQASLLKNLLIDISLYDKQFKPEVILDRIGKLKNSFTAPEDMDSTGHDPLSIITARVYPEYQKTLRAMNAVDFDDLLLLVIKLFRDVPAVLEEYREKFRYIMVDEYQDTNRVQYTLLKQLAGKRKNLCVVGDDDQSVYSWRGASLGNILDFEGDFKGTKVIRLEQNYRSMGNILTVANSVITNNSQRMVKSLWTSEGTGPVIKIIKAPDGEGEARIVVGKIQELMETRKLDHKDFAIIYRANVFSRLFEEELRRKKMPYTVVGGTSYFDRKEVKDLASYMKIILNKYDDVSLLRIANVPRRGIGITSIGKMHDHAGAQKISLMDAFINANGVEEVNAKTAANAAALADMLKRYRTDFSKGKDMAKLLAKFIDEIGLHDHIRGFYKTDDVVEKRIDNVTAFIESLKYYEENEKSPSLQGFIETLALDDKPEKEKENSGVTLVSLHSSKGLEFPVVFIVGVEQDMLPHSKSIDEPGGLEEERRLMYVGITRAMKELFLTYTAYRIKYGTKTLSMPSQFIAEMPDKVIEHIGIEGEGEEMDAEEIDIKADYDRIMGILNG
ncbi:MAG: UvrD-helicase domain-containing protein [Thermodesulfovibrionia bacterium]|nr:UvrD-helicase domain-containing protein [Thermodesulfovibrionia bacterium]